MSELITYSSNCTFMELKLMMQGKNAKPTAVLIVPLWN